MVQGNKSVERGMTLSSMLRIDTPKHIPRDGVHLRTDHAKACQTSHTLKISGAPLFLSLCLSLLYPFLVYCEYHIGVFCLRVLPPG